MTENPHDQHLKLDDWDVENLRITTFIRDRSIEQIIQDKWWENINEVPLDTEQIYHQQKVKVQQGIINGHNLTVQSQSNRIDWILTSGIPMSNESQQNAVSPSQNPLESLLQIAQKWSKACPSSSRLAFGASLVKQISDMRRGYKDLMRFLPNLKLNPDDISDLIFQVNRRKKSTSASDIMINRIGRWSIVQVKNIGVTVDASGTPISSLNQEHYACKLDLDMNTVHSSDDITRSNIYPIFKELITYGCTIANKGDTE